MAQERDTQTQLRRPGKQKPGRRSGLFVVCSPRAQRGFTITELIVTVVMVGILAAAVLPRWGGETGFEERGLRDETAAALRFAQKSAIASRRRVCLSFTANGVTATMATSFGALNCAGGAALPAPDSGTLAVAGRGSAVFSAQPGAALSFDEQGRPSARTVISVQGLPGSLDVIVEAETGYVH